MSVSVTNNRVTYVGNGSTTAFSFPYPFYKTSDFLVYIYDTVAGGITTKALGTDYTVTGTPNAQGIYPNGGTITFTVAPTTTNVAVITRSPSFVQNYTLLQNGLISSTALTQQLDYLTLITQRLQDQVNRSITLPDGFGGTFSLQIPSTIALAANIGTVLQVNPSGNGFVLAPLTAGSFSGILPVTSGGTGTGTAPTQYGVVYGGSTSAQNYTTAGSTGQALISQGGSGAPVFSLLDLTSGVTNVLPIANGGTGASTATNALTALLPSQTSNSGKFLSTNGTVASWGSASYTPPLTAKGDLFGYDTGPQRIPVGSNTFVLTADSTQALGVKWAASAANPTTTKGDLAGFDTAANRVPVGTNGQYLVADSTQALGLKWATRPLMTVTRLTTGATNYTTPSGATLLKVKMVGGGGGGGGGGASAGNGGAGGATSFGTLSAAGGSFGTPSSGPNAGGAPTIGAGWTGIVSLTGGTGSGGGENVSGGSSATPAGTGASGPWGGAGGGGIGSTGGGAGQAAATNSGAGGGGGGSNNAVGTFQGSGGSAGAYIEAFIAPTASQVFAYSIGAAGTAGATGTNGSAGGAGGSGVVIVEEYY